MLYLLPNLLSEDQGEALLPIGLQKVVQSLDGLIAESEKGGRHFLKRLRPDFRSVPLEVLSKKCDAIDPLLAPLQRGETWGLISDGGLPVLADPGALLVRRLRSLEIPVTTLPGPSSIIYALQLSGLSAQNFTFHGYPPHSENELQELLRTLSKGHTHLWIEAPYRSDAFLHKLLHHLHEKAELSVSWNLTAEDERTRTDSVLKWRLKGEKIGKAPAVFVVRRDG